MPSTAVRLFGRARDRLRTEEIIYLVAPAGHPNFGDELIARTWLEYLARARPRSTVVLDSHSPGQAAVLLRGAHPRAVFTDTLWQLTLHAGQVADGAAENDDIDPQRPWDWVARAATEVGPAPRLAEGVQLFRRAAVVHLLGGGYVNNVWPHHVSLVVAAATLARRTGALAYATGQGLIPTVDGERWTALREAIDAFTVFDVRDDASAQALTGSAARRHSGDDAWLSISPAAQPATAAISGRVNLCLQADLVDDFVAGDLRGPAALAEVVTRILDTWQVSGDEITIVECIPGQDMVIPRHLGDRLAGSRLLPFVDVWHHGLPIGRGDTWVSTRFHPHLLAAAAGDSGVAIMPRPDYYATKHQSLADAGSRWTLLSDPDRVPVRPEAGGFSADARTRAVAHKRALARRLYPWRPK